MIAADFDIATTVVDVVFKRADTAMENINLHMAEFERGLSLNSGHKLNSK